MFWPHNFLRVAICSRGMFTGTIDPAMPLIESFQPDR